MASSLQEQILVVKRSLLFSNQPIWHGVKSTNIATIISRITQHQEYIQRSLAENDDSFKQIIPYMIFTYSEKYFVMERKLTASEQRLAGKLSLGIGGHIRKEDMQGQTIFDWAQREFNEEVAYSGTLSITTLGILNDDSNEVGKVHLGLVLLLQGDNDNIHIKDEHKSGALYFKEECLKKIDQMESWSQLILPLLK